MGDSNESDSCMCCRRDFVAFESQSKCTKCGNTICNNCLRHKDLDSDSPENSTGANNIICKDCEFMGKWVSNVKEKTTTQSHFWNNIRMPKFLRSSKKDLQSGRKNSSKRPNSLVIPTDVKKNLASLSREKLKELNEQKRLVKELQEENEKMKLTGCETAFNQFKQESSSTIASLQKQIERLLEENEKLKSKVGSKEDDSDENDLDEANQTHSSSASIVATTVEPVAEDPKYQKYRKMQKAGLPEGAIMHAATKDGIQLPENFFTGPAPAAAAPEPVPEDPKYQKYRKMQKAGLPEGAIMHAAAKDGMQLPENFFSGPVPAAAAPPPVEEDPKFKKYRQMQKAGLPEGAVMHAAAKDGVVLPENFFSGPSAATAASAPTAAPTKPAEPPKNKYDISKRPAARQSNEKLKGIFWNVLPGKRVEKSFWVSMENDFPFKVSSHLSRLETGFGKVEAKKFAISNASQSSSAAAAANEAPQSLLNDKRVHNLSIMLAGWKESNSALRKKIVNIDNEFLTMEIVHKLIPLAPTPEETQKFQAAESAWQGSGNFGASLSGPDEFVYEMSKVPRLRQRLQAIFVEMSFERQVEVLHENLEKYEAALHQLSASSDWKKLLHFVLLTGNYLNASNSRIGGAWGIECSTALQKLEDTKANDNSKYSLLHWLAEVIHKEAPELLNLGEKLSKVQMVLSLSVNDLESDTEQLARGATLVKREIEACEKNPDGLGAGRFVATMKPFLENIAEPEAERLRNTMKRVKNQAEEFLVSHGEIPSKCSSTQLMSTAINFCKALKRANAENLAPVAEESTNNEKKKVIKVRKMSNSDKQKLQQAKAQMGQKAVSEIFNAKRRLRSTRDLPKVEETENTPANGALRETVKLKSVNKNAAVR